jgi:Ca-activated chloride channel family protein
MLKWIMFFSFEYPLVLLLLAFSLCFVLCKVHSHLYYISKLSWLPHYHAFWQPLLWLKVALFALMVFALALPFSYAAKEKHTKKGRDVVVAIDASGSMGESRFSSQAPTRSKFQSAIALTSAFIAERFDDNIGVVLFGTFAYSASPLTYDLQALSKMLHYTTVGIAGENTAIGDALVESLRVLSFGHAKERVVILLTDGFHNAGKHSPHQAVKLAQESGVKVYTIGLGEEKHFDMPLLEKIAQETGAKSYTALKATDLEKVYSEIDALEPSEIPNEAYLEREVLGVYFIMVVWLLLLLWYLKEER